MSLVSRTCYVFSLKVGAISTFTFTLLVSLFPLYRVSKFITRIPITIALLNMCQALFAIFAGVLAIVGGLYKIPELILLFLVYYIGLLLIDLASIVGTIVLSHPFDAHDLLSSINRVSNKPSSEFIWIRAAFSSAFIFLLRLYFIAVVYSYYEQLKYTRTRTSEEGSIEESSSAAVASSSPKNLPKNTRT